jgi:hypothetical protein
MLPSWEYVEQFILSTLLSAGFATAIAQWLGSRWLKKAEAKYNRELEGLKAKYAAELESYKNELERSKQMLQAEIDKTFLVTKVHFETEFDALKKVFALLADVRLQMPNLRPALRIVPSGETKEDRYKQLSLDGQKLEAVYNQLVMTSENLSPFYPHEIYLQIGKCEEWVRWELTDIALSGMDAISGTSYSKAEKHLKEFMAAYGKVSELIRERITRLAIIRAS